MDPAGDGSVGSDFSGFVMGLTFGVYFQMDVRVPSAMWNPISQCRTHNTYFVPTFFPKALKFTFTVYDAKGLYPEGRTFTQIVTID